jgi:hypothetical protein
MKTKEIKNMDWNITGSNKGRETNLLGGKTGVVLGWSIEDMA